MRRREVVCQEWVELVTAYLDGSLPGRLHRAVDRHLAGCPGCRAYLEQIRSTIALCGRIPVDDVPPEVVEVLQAALGDYYGRGGSGQ